MDKIERNENPVKIKICGLTREDDIKYVNQVKPDYIGFVFARKSRRYLSPEQAARLRHSLKPEIVPVGVFVNEEPELVSSLLNENIIELAQLHGQEDEKYIRNLRTLTSKPILQAFRIEKEEDLEKAEKSSADYILLDHGAGGTGEVFSWSLLRKMEKPWFLAGGLTPENVKEALQIATPYGVDISSGVETDGKKDLKKIQKFIEAVRNYK